MFVIYTNNCPDPFPPEFYVKYLNTEKVQKAIGAFVNFTESSSAVGEAFGKTGDDAREANTIEDMQKLIRDDVTVVMYYGQLLLDGWDNVLIEFCR